MAVPLIAEGLPLHAEALLLQLKALLLPFRDEMGTFYFLIFNSTKNLKFFVTNPPNSSLSRIDTGLSIGR